MRVEDATHAPRYMGLVIRGVRVASSPDWLVARLKSVGASSINNVVDASNYVLHELGQPTHAFDLSKLAGGAVVVRTARKGEKLTTLDGVARTLGESITVIADAQRAQAIAGVMGGEEQGHRQHHRSLSRSRHLPCRAHAQCPQEVGSEHRRQLSL